jgi:phytoene dehydrogenase-like protein
VGGWPIAEGGSQGISDALAAQFKALGGQLRTGVPVRDLRELPSSRIIMLDVTPRQLNSLAAGVDNPRRRRMARYRYGPGVFKVDWALDGPIPWRNVACARAATVHVGGTFEEIERAEGAVGRGTVSDRPFVLLAQPSLFDPSRAPAGRHVAWGYTHVPNGWRGDMLPAIEAQIERFAPGFRDRIIARHTMAPADFEAYNANYVGGDISGGANDILQLFRRPTLWPSPYFSGAKGVYLCSASTPPGGGVHGMCGHHAALAALHRECPNP